MADDTGSVIPEVRSGLGCKVQKWAVRRECRQANGWNLGCTVTVDVDFPSGKIADEFVARLTRLLADL